MKRRTPASIVLILSFVAVMAGCDTNSPDTESPPVTSVFVANQGNFSDGNGSVTRFDPATGQVTTVLSQASSIVQSIAAHNGILYAAMNTGNRIDILTPERGLIGQVVDVASPRYMAWADDDRLLVTNLFDNTLSVVSLATNSVVVAIEVGPNPEGVIVHNGLAYVANHGFGSGTTVTVVDLATSRVSRTLGLGCDGPRFLSMDREADLWVVCTGQTLFDSNFNIIGMTDGAVLVVDGSTGAERLRFDLDGMVSTPGPGQDAFYSDEAEALFVVLGGDRIVEFDTAADRMAGQLGPLDGPPIGSVAFDSESGRLYVGRVPGFTQAGEVTIIDRVGNPIGSFTAGVAPSHIVIMRTPATSL